MKYYTVLKTQASKIFRSKKYLILMGSILLLVILSSTAFGFMYQGNSNSILAQASNTKVATDENTKPTIVNPNLLSGSSSVILLGSVISNETANIYPRRDGIVEDVYIDIGDSVKKGQTLAILLSKGVEGQSAAAILEKKAREEQAIVNLTSAEALKEEALINSRQKVIEKETELKIAKNNSKSLLSKFQEQSEQILQMTEQTFTKIQTTKQYIEHILTGTNSRNSAQIYEEDILDYFGLLNTQTRYEVIYSHVELLELKSKFENLSDKDKKEQIFPLLLSAINTLDNVISLLSATETVPSTRPGKISHTEHSEIFNKILSYKESLLIAQEKLQDAHRAFETLSILEPELFRAFKSGNTDDVKSNAIKKIESQIMSLNNSVYLTEAQQNQIIENKRTMINIASAQLQSEYAQSGHRTIISPFTGIVSKRFVDVGQKVSMSTPVFELTGVPTTLAKKAKSEIQFGLPEYLMSALNIGDSVSFFVNSNETNLYTAEVTRISPQVDLKTHTVTVQAKIPDEINLPHQSSIRVRLIDNNSPIFQVPSFVVKREEDKNFLWIINSSNGETEKLYVSVISEDGEFAEITGDLSKETKVLASPPDLLP